MANLPVALAPVGITGMQCADGEIKPARAAEAFGMPYTLSTMSICSIEDVAEAIVETVLVPALRHAGRDFTASLIERRQGGGMFRAGLTLDLQILGQRHQDLKNGLTVPPS